MKQTTLAGTRARTHTPEIRTIHEWDYNKNAVLMWYQNMADKPFGCVVKFHDYSISHTIYRTGFNVFKNSENLSKRFETLREAKRFIIDKINKRSKLF